MNRKGMAIVVLIAVILILLFAGGGRRSGYGAAPGVAGYNVANLNSQHTLGASHPMSGAIDPAPVGQMGDNIGQTVSSASLIPRDVVATEDFGQFSPDKILGNQNYLDPRSQIGYPETLGGVLRNANRQERSEPLNPRTPVSIFNLSTIPPDVMRPKFEIDYEYH
jgi:hypothetical protein